MAADTFTTNLSMRLQGTGNNENSWGTKINDDVIAILDLAVADYLSKSVAGSSNVVLTATETYSAFLEFTGVLTGNIEVQPVDASEMSWHIYNNTTGDFTLTFRNTAGGTGVLIPRGDRTLLWNDGTNIQQMTMLAAFSATEQTVNSFGVDIDFRVKGLGDDNLLFLDAGNDRIGIGVAAPAFKLDVDAGTATTIANFVSTSDGADAALTILNDAGSGSTDETVSLIFQHVDANGPGGKIVSGRVSDYSSNAAEDSFLDFYTARNGTDTVAARLDWSGKLFINEDTNTKAGGPSITINQGAIDDEILAFKSSDVGHGVTTRTETDTFAYFQKVTAGATGGGLRIESITELANGLLLNSIATTEDTTDTSASGGNLFINAALKSGTGITGHADTANIFTFSNNSVVRLLIKGNGVLHATNITAGSGDLDGVVLDKENDVDLVRVFERTIHKDIGVVMSKWDEQIKVNEDDLKRVGVLSSGGDFYNMQRMNSLLGGAIWQQHTRQCAAEERELYLMQLLEEDTPGITARMQAKLANAQMPQLPI